MSTHLPSKIRLLLLVCLPTLPVQAGHAAGLVDDAGLWSQIEGVVHLARFDPKLERFLLSTTGEARFFDDFNHLSQGIIRLMPGFRFDEHITLLFGYTWLPNDPIHGRSFDEHDINQAFSWALNPDWGQLKTRTMIEWRFVSNDSQMAVRLRQRVRAHIPLPSVDPRLSLIGWEEIFINTNTVDWGPVSGFDQNRAFAGFGWELDKQAHFSLELGYLNQYLHHPGRDDLLNHMLFTSFQFKF
ncbi:MAG: DUF2490 domain-containing protein [Gammaproteobacteria bacterium]